MKHYINKNKEIFAFELDGSQDHLITPDMIEISLEEITEMRKPSPEEIEIQRIQAIKSKAGELINSKYPDYKQLNIIRVGGSELDAMTAYIDVIRAISNEAETNGIKVEDIQWES